MRLVVKGFSHVQDVHDGGSRLGPRSFVLACVVVALAIGAGRADAQSRDGLVNGTVIGAAVGAGIGVAFAHATRDSDLVFSQYARGALIFGAIGAGVGVGVDALLNRRSPGGGVSPRRVLIAPAVGVHFTGVAVKWRW
jgi:hypothetical protein